MGYDFKFLNRWIETRNILAIFFPKKNLFWRKKFENSLFVKLMLSWKSKRNKIPLVNLWMLFNSVRITRTAKKKRTVAVWKWFTKRTKFQRVPFEATRIRKKIISLRSREKMIPFAFKKTAPPPLSMVWYLDKFWFEITRVNEAYFSFVKYLKKFRI